MNRMGEGEEHRGYLQQVITRKENTSLTSSGSEASWTKSLLIWVSGQWDWWWIQTLLILEEYCSSMYLSNKTTVEKKVKKKNFSLFFFFYNNDKNSTNSAETRIYSSLQTPQSLCLRICSSFLTHSILLALRSLSLSLSCHATIGVDSCIISA